MGTKKVLMLWSATALSILLLLVLGVVWLWISTRTNQLLETIQQLDQRREALREEINALWIELGEQTAPNVMEMRARQLNFAPARAKEYAGADPGTQR